MPEVEKKIENKIFDFSRGGPQEMKKIEKCFFDQMQKLIVEVYSGLIAGYKISISFLGEKSALSSLVLSDRFKTKNKHHHSILTHLDDFGALGKMLIAP